MVMAARCCEDRRQPGPRAVSPGIEGLRRTLADTLAIGQTGSTPVLDLRPRRYRLFELDMVYHCSVVGTCFQLGELRRLLTKLGTDMSRASDHAVHHEAVLVAGRRDQAGKLLSKALDRKFKATINRFAAGLDGPALGRLWDEAVGRGEIPEAYWAILSHAGTPAELVRRVFGEVHMLSHLVGAANRADIRRLQLIERERDDLSAKLDRQQRHLAETLGAKESRIRELEALLAGRESITTPDAASAALGDAFRREARRRARLERRVETLEARLRSGTVAKEAAPPRAEPVAIPEPEETPAARPAMPALAGATLLLVGGRTGQVPDFARAIAEAGGSLLHHDGGVEMNLGLLPGLAQRADRIVVDLACVSHAAAGAVRRLAREGDKPLLSLPGLSLSGLARALGEQPTG